MLKSLLSIVLLATQVLSWNAVPVYLCLGADGSICVDFGPASCGCCRLDLPATGGCESEHGRHDDHARLKPLGLADVDPCGCTHVEISQHQQATLNRATEVQDAHRSVTTPAVSSDLAGACCQWATGQTALRARAPEAPSGSLGERSSIVLRC
jgi:hypothetical protein